MTKKYKEIKIIIKFMASISPIESK